MPTPILTFFMVDPTRWQNGFFFFSVVILTCRFPRRSRISVHDKATLHKAHGRLADVLALIQVLAFDPHTHRSEAHVIDNEIGTPCSAKGWIVLAKEHPEMFRVSEEDKHPLSLIARHVQPLIPGDLGRNDSNLHLNSRRP